VNEHARWKRYVEKLLPSKAHESAARIIRRVKKHVGVPLPPRVQSFLERSLHGIALTPRLHTFDAELLEDWTWDERHTDEGLERCIVFADDGGDDVYLLDPASSVGLGEEVVLLVGKGSMDLGSARVVALSLVDFLAIVTGEAKPIDARVADLLKERQPSASTAPVRIGDVVVAADDVTDVTYHPGGDKVRTLRLRRPLHIDDITYAAQDSLEADLELYKNGKVKSGWCAEGSARGCKLEPGSFVAFDGKGRLLTFTPVESVMVRGVRCKPHEQIIENRDRVYSFVPAEDAEYGEPPNRFPCKAGTRVDDYCGNGLHLTISRDLTFKGHPVPAGVRITVTGDGGLRFDLVDDTLIDGNLVRKGAHVWYAGDGTIKEIQSGGDR